MKFGLLSFVWLGLSLAVIAQPSTEIQNQQSTPDPLVIVQDKRTPQTLMSGANCTVITKEDIQKLPARNVSEVLMNVAGVDVRSRNPFAQNDISLLGASFDQVLILIDGIPMRDPQTGHHQMNLPVDISQVERIEVFKGSAARVYGAGALAGAINIITKKPTENSIQVLSYWGTNFEKDEVSGEQYNANIQQIGLGFVKNNWGHNVQIRRLYSNGYAYNTGVEQQSIFTNSRWESANKKSSVQVINGYLNNGFGAKDFYVSPWDSESFEQVETFFTGINGTVESNGWTIVPRAYFRYNHDHYVFIKDNPSYYQNHHFSNTGGIELHASHANPWGLWGAGIENRNDWINSNNLGKHDRQLYSGYIEQRFNQWKDLKVIVGLNLQFSNMSHPMNYSSNGIRYYPAIDIQYKKGKGLLFAHSGTGSRLPTYTDWFYSDSGNQGNSSLVPENAFTAETGFQYQNQNFFVQGSYFYRDVKNQIDWILNTETNKYVAGNLTQCQFTGSEIAVKWNNTNKKNWFNIGNVSLRNTLLTNNIKFEGASSKYINDHLSHQAVMQLGFNTGKYIQHQIIGRHYQRFNTEKPSLILDWRTQYNNANWTVFADITNLNNQEYKLSGFVTMPGRFFNLGVQYRLK
jgi:vitamin B12 transporter